MNIEGLKPITLELARQIAQKGEFLADIPSPFSAPDGRKCDTVLAIYDYKFFILTVLDMPEKDSVALMKTGHFELSLAEAKSFFGNQVDFVDIKVESVDKVPTLYLTNDAFRFN